MEKFIIPENIKKVLDILEENGYEAFVVGGIAICYERQLKSVEDRWWTFT